MKKFLAIALLLSVLMTCACVQAETADETVSVTASVCDFSEKWGDKFLEKGSEAVIDGYTYKSHDVSIEITTFRQNNSDVYVADIYVRDLSLLRRGYGYNKWGYGSQKLSKIAENNDAIIAITGDDGHVLNKGIVYGNGELLRKTSNQKRELGIIFTDGTMTIIPGRDKTINDIEALCSELGKDIWHVFLFGPGILDEDGHAKTQFNSDVKVENPRSVIGYYEPGHYCLVQIDGRKTQSKLELGKKNYGMTLAQVSILMEQLGCAAAYNLDGGRSSMMWFNGEVITSPEGGGRKIGDIIYVPICCSCNTPSI